MKVRLPLAGDPDDATSWPEFDVCESKDCDALAVARVWWPTEPLLLCNRCTARALRVAEHLGMRLRTEALLLPYAPPKRRTMRLAD